MFFIVELCDVTGKLQYRKVEAATKQQAVADTQQSIQRLGMVELVKQFRVASIH